MFEFFQGELSRKAPAEVVVECGGVGYVLAISLKTFEALPARGRVQVLAHLHQAEAGTRLFGFAGAAERTMFRLLLTVRGVGPSLALTLLSHETPARLAAQIGQGDVKGLTRIKGIGTKTAERLVLELKGRLGEVAEGGADGGTPSHERLVAQALQSLGLQEAEARERARAVVQELPGEARLEVLLRHALKTNASARAV